MLYSHHFRTPSQKFQIDQQNFSFVDGFSDEKEQKTMTHSTTKNSDFETNSCCTCEIGTDYHKQSQEQFFSERQQEQGKKDKMGSLAYGLNISKQINYNSPEQYQEILQNLLNDFNIDQQNKTYLRLVILDKQLSKDSSLQQYFDRAMEEYRLCRQCFFSKDFNSALGRCRNLS